MDGFRGALIILAGVAAWPAAALAQPPGPVRANSPAFSPYLNLLRRDAPAGVNYYGLVRPQIATMNGLQALDQRVAVNQQQLVQLSSPRGTGRTGTDLPETGQQTFFQNNGGYFQNHRTGGGVTNPTATTRSITNVARPPVRTR